MGALNRLISTMTAGTAFFLCLPASYGSSSAIDHTDITAAATQSYTQFISNPQIRIVKNTPDVAIIRKASIKLATAVQRYLQDNDNGTRYVFNWQINVVDSKEANAFVFPGGEVAVYTGILPLTKDETGVAVVLAHEIAHIVGNHADDIIKKQYKSENHTSPKSGVDPALVAIISSLYGLNGSAATLKYSPKDEDQADKLALNLMALAGYDPHVALAFWQRVETQGNGSVLLTIHPVDDARLAGLQKHVAEAARYYHPVPAGTPRQ